MHKCPGTKATPPEETLKIVGGVGDNSPESNKKCGTSSFGFKLSMHEKTLCILHWIYCIFFVMIYSMPLPMFLPPTSLAICQWPCNWWYQVEFLKGIYPGFDKFSFGGILWNLWITTSLSFTNDVMPTSVKDFNGMKISRGIYSIQYHAFSYLNMRNW